MSLFSCGPQAWAELAQPKFSPGAPLLCLGLLFTLLKEDTHTGSSLSWGQGEGVCGHQLKWKGRLAPKYANLTSIRCQLPGKGEEEPGLPGLQEAVPSGMAPG